MSETIVVVGAGHCAGQLGARLRAEGHDGPVVLIGSEPSLPYQRPPLSKAYLAGDVELDKVLLRPASFYEESDIDVELGATVTDVDRNERTVSLDDGRALHYGRLVLACGSIVRRLQVPGADLDGVLYLRTLADCDAIRARCQAGSRLAVVGGGYIGLEVASVAAGLGVSVTVLETEPRLMSRVVAPQISEFYRALHAAADVEVLLGVEVTGFEGDGALARLRLRDGSALETDFAAVGVGILPNVGVAAAAGLEVDNGVVVDECGATSDPQIWAAGDCTSHPSALYQRRIRLESVHNAMAQAKAVAGNLCGKSAPYDEAPWFWSDQYDTKLQIAGLAQVAQETVMRGTPDDGAFTVFHINDGVVVAADTVNAMRDHIACRKLVGERARIRPEVLADTDIPVQELASRAQ